MSMLSWIHITGGLNDLKHIAKSSSQIFAAALTMSKLVLHMRANAALNAPCPHQWLARTVKRTVMSCMARSSTSNPHPAVNGIGAHSPSHPSTPPTPSAISATTLCIPNLDDVITVSDPLQAAYDKGFKASFTVTRCDSGTAASVFEPPTMACGMCYDAALANSLRHFQLLPLTCLSPQAGLLASSSSPSVTVAAQNQVHTDDLNCKHDVHTIPDTASQHRVMLSSAQLGLSILSLSASHCLVFYILTLASEHCFGRSSLIQTGHCLF